MILFSSSPLATAALGSGQDELELYYFGVKSRRRFPAPVAGVLWSYSRCHSRPFPALVAGVLCRCCNRLMPRVAGVLSGYSRCCNRSSKTSWTGQALAAWVATAVRAWVATAVRACWAAWSIEVKIHSYIYTLCMH